MGTEEIRCPSCGAGMPASGSCRYCKAAVAVDGVTARLVPGTLRCPRCKGAPSLQGFVQERLAGELCTSCHGVWFPLGVLEQAIREAVDRPRGPAEGRRGPAHGGVEPVRYARCPQCDGGMARVPFSRKPLVIIDRCAAHGDWCDGGELGQLKAVARAQGVEAAVWRAPARQVEKPSTAFASSLPIGGGGADGLFTREVLAAGGRGSRGPDLFDILWALFSAA